MEHSSGDARAFARDAVEYFFFGLMAAYVGLILAIANAPVCQ